MSLPEQLIDAVIAAGLAPAAKAAGFKKQARTFRRRDGEAILVTNVQASRSNLGDHGRFTVNLGVFFPAVDARSSVPERDPARPSEPGCQLRRRLGELLPAAEDRWWDVTPGTDATALGREIADLWRGFGVPWLEGHRELGPVADRLVQADQLWLAIQFRMAQERRDDARALLERLLADPTKPPGHRDHVAGWARTHGLG